MKHETFHELLALRLYGELSPDEERALTGHLATCEDCRAFGRELAGTLGVLAQTQAGARERDLPGDWTARLAGRIAVARRRRRLQPLATFAAGLAAGLVLMSVLRSPQGPLHPPPGGDAIAGAPPFVLRSDPPPPATGRGQLARLGSMRRR